jgi:plastocyanin domain-containing protein
MKTTAIAIIVAGLLIGGAFMLSTTGNGVVVNTGGSNVSIVDGKQIIEINVKGGYRPGKTVAKAGIPTVIRFKTNSTFDCSSFIRIPSLSVSQALPQTGATDVSLGIPSAGVLQGTCSMGMYRFEVDFQ